MKTTYGNEGRWLIVNADDFGLSEGVNDGIVRAHHQGIVTSASLMVLWPAAVDALNRAGKIALGLHVDLGEWAFRNGEWIALYERLSLEDAPAVEAEVNRQLDEFTRLAGRMPTHIDSHQHVHTHEPIRSIVKRLADKLSVPLRGHASEIRYSGRFYGQSGEGAPYPDGISVPAIMDLLTELPAGVTELGCHPGEDAELDSQYCQERFQEVQVLCDPRVRQKVEAEGIRLCTFPDVSTCDV
jgi:chitin disaccharide deacetylase